MARDGRVLPEGWERPIPEANWPDFMISVVASDPAALSSPRVIETIRRWQRAALEDADPRARREAKRLLEALGRALLPAPPALAEAPLIQVDADPTYIPEPEGDDYTVDAIQLPPKPRLRRAVLTPSDTPPAVIPAAPRAESDRTPSRVFLDSGVLDELALEAEESDTDSRVKLHPPAKAPVVEIREEDEGPTRAFLRGETGSRPPPPPPPPLPPEALLDSRPRVALAPPFEEDEKPTRHIELPDEVLKIRPDLAAITPEPTEMAFDLTGRAASDDDDEMDATHALDDGTAPEPVPSFAAIEAPPSGAVRRPLPKDAPTEQPGDVRSHGRLAPKPGIIRRRGPREDRSHSAPRPRAAMQPVRMLHAVLLPFAEELIPLPYERRSRRFWARWREVAGDRGVRREFVEELLRSTNDTRTLVCELIAEVQTVDVRSVSVLVEKIEEGRPEESVRAASMPSREIEAAQDEAAERHRGPLVGASVRVEGVSLDED